MEKLLTDLIKFHKIYLKYMQAVGYDSPKIIGRVNVLPFSFFSQWCV